MSDSNEITTIHGDPHLQREPIHLKTPDRHPTPDQIIAQRKNRLTPLTHQECADICGIDRSTWSRYESGKSKMPRGLWGWFLVMTNGNFFAGGEDWEGWNLYQGELYSPEGWGRFTPGDLRAWPILHAQLAELRQKNARLEKELQAEKEKKPETILEQRDRAIDQINAVGEILSQLMKGYTTSSDPVLQQVGTHFSDVLRETISTGKAPLLKLCR